MKELVALEKKMDKRFDDLTALMSKFANDVNDRFEQVDARFDQIDVRFYQIDTRFESVELRLGRIEASLDGGQLK